MPTTNSGPVSRRQIPKLCGADIELGNFILGQHPQNGRTGYQASRALLREIRGYPEARTTSYFQTSLEERNCEPFPPAAYPYPGGSPKTYGYGETAYASSYRESSYGGYAYGYNPQDVGRRFLASNGGCWYIDLDHAEVCLPEVLSARDFVAALHAMFRIGRMAQLAANAKLPPGQELQILVNNSDGQGSSYGGHIDVLVTRRAWENIFQRKIHYLLYLAAFHVSSIVITGQGKVGTENRTSPAPFQISQRADFFETLTGTQTTYSRPIVNSRDEPLCGYSRQSDMARLHCIFYDTNLCHVSNLLKVGTLQILLSMIEAEHVDSRLILDDPLDALLRWSRDPELQTRARLVSRKKVTAVELQLLFFECAKDFVAAGRCEGLVPHAKDIIQLWEDTLVRLQKRDVGSLVGRLDWVLKLHTLQQAMRHHTELSWDSPEIKHLDHLYASLDPTKGLYWVWEQDGVVEKVVSDAHIEQFTHTPPENTRAWTRAMLLRTAGGERVDYVDWDAIRFKLGRWGWPTRTAALDNPLGFTKMDTEHIFANNGTLNEILDGLEELAGMHSVESVGMEEMKTQKTTSPTLHSPTQEAQPAPLPVAVRCCTKTTDEGRKNP